MMKRLRLAIIITIPALCFIWAILYLAKPSIPSDVRKKAAFTIFIPSDSSAIKVDSSTLKYDDSNHGIAYQIAVNGKTVLMSEQATPDSFADGPAYSYLLQKSQVYDALDTRIGKLSLTHPKELKGAQVGIINPPGTLIFARPTKDLTRDEWSQLFNAMTKPR
jgi:hypothetical protein